MYRDRVHFASAYSVVDYNANSSGCNGLDDSDLICRCSTINQSGIDVESVDLAALTVAFVPESMLAPNKGLPGSSIADPLDSYVAQRIARGFSVWARDNWDFYIDGGYYGEEVSGVSFYHAEFAEAMAAFCALPCTPAGRNERMRLALLAEYGHLLPALADAEFELTTLQRDDIVVGRPDYLAELTAASDAMYYLYPARIFTSQKNRSPIALVDDTASGMRLLDGYHRVALFDRTPRPLTPTGRLKKLPPLLVVVARHPAH
jgi:hypothetical protein